MTPVIIKLWLVPQLCVMDAKRRMPAQSGAVYGMGLIGSLVYFIQHAATFGMGCLGVLKALFWPAYLAYKLFEFLKA